MYDEDIVDPIPCPAAFREGGEAARCSQAALLLVLGIALRREYAPLLSTLVEQPPFELPNLRPVDGPVSQERFERVMTQVTGELREVPANRVRLIAAEALYRDSGEHRNADSALRLLAAALMESVEVGREGAGESSLGVEQTA